MIVVVDYGTGNLRSIENMLRKLGISSMISGDTQVILEAARLILPGVGHFRYGMECLEKCGLVEVLTHQVLTCKIPVLGICLGAQLLGRWSEEGDCEGLGWLPMNTVRFDASQMATYNRIPHMGWADTQYSQHPIFKDLVDPRFYYVHSFHFQCDDSSMIIGTAEHGYRFPSVVAKENVLGVQFHPEKSHSFGMQLLKNFATMNFKPVKS